MYFVLLVKGVVIFFRTKANGQCRAIPERRVFSSQSAI